MPTIGEGTYGDVTVLFEEGPHTCKIGKYCSIANGVQFMLHSEHHTEWVTNYPFPAFVSGSGYRSPGKGNILVGSDVWIGNGATIMSGVMIGDGAVIATKAVVTKDVPPYTIVGGVPAKVIKKRFSEEQIHKLLQIRWWNWDREKIKAAIPLLCQPNIDLFISTYGVPEAN